MDEATLSAVRAAMMTAKTPGAYDKVYKVRVARPRRVAFRSRTDRTFASAPSLLEIWRARRLTPAPSALRSQDECVYSYDTPLSPTGLYVNLSTHHGVGEAHLALDHEKTGNVLYLHQRWVKTPKPADAAAAAAAAVPTKIKSFPQAATPGKIQHTVYTSKLKNGNSVILDYHPGGGVHGSAYWKIYSESNGVRTVVGRIGHEGFSNFSKITGSPVLVGGKIVN